tara:strand:+ start:48 stop:269 length:222 start_codon:yes stop_codon:yes gene_type:complete
MSLPQLNKKKDPVMNSSTTIKSKQEKVFRKAVLADFLVDTRSLVSEKPPPTTSEKEKRYRIQKEFGEKKFIKP